MERHLDICLHKVFIKYESLPTDTLAWLRAKSVIIDPFYSKLPINLSLLLTLPSTHLSHLALSISDTPCHLPSTSLTLHPGTFELTVPMARLDVLEWLLDKVRPTERLEVKVTGGDVEVERVASVMEGVRCPVDTLSVVLE
jgi:hypothetical protein